MLRREALGAVSRVVLVGSAAARDVFNLFVAGGGPAGGIEVHGGRAGGSSAQPADVMNVYGRTGSHDRIRVGAAATDVNGTRIDYSGIETTRIVTVQMDTGVLAQLVSWWDPLDED